MYKNSVINEIMRDIKYLQSGFSFDVINGPYQNLNFSNIDELFSSIWQQINPYFFSDEYFGSIDTVSHKGFWGFGSFSKYIEFILKRECVIYALEKSKEISTEGQYLTINNLSKSWEDLGFFAMTNAREGKDSRFDFSLSKSIDDQKKNKIKLSKREKSLQRIIKKYVNNSIENNPDPIESLRKKGNALNTKVKRYRDENKIRYISNNIIRWKDDKTQSISFFNSDLVYRLINHEIVSFESSINNLQNIQIESMKDDDKKNIVKCLRNHFNCIDLFREFDQGNQYDIVDTLILNHSIEKYFSLDFLYDIIQMRREILCDKTIEVDSKIDDILIKAAQIPLPFTRNLFVKFAVDARSNLYFKDKDNERNLINMQTKEHKQAYGRFEQNMKWCLHFDDYTKHLVHIFTPLLYSVFVGALYRSVALKSEPEIKKHNAKVQDCLYNYITKNFILFTFPVSENSSINYFDEKGKVEVEGKYHCFDETQDPNEQIFTTQKKAKKFIDTEITELKDHEFVFLKRFYTEVFETEGKSKGRKTGFWEMYEKLCINPIKINEGKTVVKDQETVICSNYRIKKSELDIQFMLGLINMD